MFWFRHALSLDTRLDARAAVNYWIERMSNDEGDDLKSLRDYVRENCEDCGDFNKYYRRAPDARIYIWSVCRSADGIHCVQSNLKPTEGSSEGDRSAHLRYIFADIPETAMTSEFETGPR